MRYAETGFQLEVDLSRGNMGGYGYILEYNVERMMRDAKHVTLVEGTTQIQKLIIARQLLGGDYV